MLESVWDHALHKQLGRQYESKLSAIETSFRSVLDDERYKVDSYELCSRPPKSAKGPLFTHMRVTDQVLDQVFKQFPASHSHTVLFLAHNQLSDTGFVQIASFLKQDTQVRHLILSHNHIVLTEFAKAGLADLLKTNHYLGWLVFGYNHIGDEGAVHLAMALKDNCGLKHVVVSGNCIGDEGVTALFDSVLGHPTLESLFIAENELTEGVLAGACEFVRALSVSSCFQRLDMSGHGFCNEASMSQLRCACDQAGVTLIL